jgi:Tol biopolymer transport system component/DNA-binding winged helix-turn-helix (wHTH) protein
LRTRKILRFGPFRLDAAAKVLLRDDEPVRLARKSVETLLALLENPGQVVTKEDLMAAVWPDRIVDEANLAQNIAVIRKAIAAAQGEPGHIETFAGRGYRILGPVTASEEAGGETGRESPGESEAKPPPPGRRVSVALVAAGALALVAVGALLIVLLRRGGPAPPAQLRRIPVTRLAGKEYQPVVTADGSNVAFVWEQEDPARTGIWVQAAGENSPRRISNEEAVHSSPAWSPDGRRLAYLRFKGPAGAIVVASLDSRQERVVASVFPGRYGIPNRHLDWSLDGRWLVIDDAEAAGKPFGIFLISLDTGEKKRLTQPRDDIIGDIDPRFSPDGRTVSFVRAFHRAWQELCAVPTAGGKTVQLTSDARQISGQDWMPNGRSLVFGSDRGGEFRLWRLAYPPGRTPAIEPTALYGDFMLQLSIARKAPVLVYSMIQHDLTIWRLDLEAKGAAASRWTRLIASSGQDASPQYSPRGDKICFRSDRSGPEQLWICDGDGSNPIQVTHGSLRPSVARWSPDGQGLAFNDARTREIFVARLAADGTWAVRPVGARAIHPVYSPDGRWIYAGTEDSIVRIPADGGPATTVVKITGISLGIAADGKRIYFVREPAGTDLWRVDTATGRAEKVLGGMVPYCSSCWALARGGIYYLGTTEGSIDKQTLRYRDFASGADKAVLDYPEAVSPLGSGPFSLSPDGRYLLCVRVHPSDADVFRVEPFR